MYKVVPDTLELQDMTISGFGVSFRRSIAPSQNSGRCSAMLSCISPPDVRSC